MTRRNQFMHDTGRVRLKRVKPTAEAPAEKPRPYDEVGAIMAYEQGDLSTRKTLELFAHLIQTGLVWSLQGSYGRAAKSLIEQGYITKEGTPTQKALDVLAKHPDEW